MVRMKNIMELLWAFSKKNKSRVIKNSNTKIEAKYLKKISI